MQQVNYLFLFFALDVNNRIIYFCFLLKEFDGPFISIRHSSQQNVRTFFGKIREQEICLVRQINLKMSHETF